jgi:DNA-binding MarR family transcriptional regulator
MQRHSRIQKELHQSRPFRSSTVEAGASILRTAALIRYYLNAVLEPHGLTWPQYNVLRILRGAGPGGLPTRAIGDRMVDLTPGVTRLVDRLVDKGYVERTRGTEDHRHVLCSLTGRGAELLARLEATVDAADDFMMSGLDEERLGTLIELLDGVRMVLVPEVVAG